ncbi:hypothetical protein SUGI_0529500 [Cryptomeria japonica]|nr:hypothetical protein SUGI_0529500 [Cryptomeria japonica]
MGQQTHSSFQLQAKFFWIAARISHQVQDFYRAFMYLAFVSAFNGLQIKILSTACFVLSLKNLQRMEMAVKPPLLLPVMLEKVCILSKCRFPRLLYLMKQIVLGTLPYEENWSICCFELLTLSKFLHLLKKLFQAPLILKKIIGKQQQQLIPSIDYATQNGKWVDVLALEKEWHRDNGWPRSKYFKGFFRLQKKKVEMPNQKASQDSSANFQRNGGSGNNPRIIVGYGKVVVENSAGVLRPSLATPAVLDKDKPLGKENSVDKSNNPIGVSNMENVVPLGDASLLVEDVQKDKSLMGIDSPLGLHNEGGLVMNSAKFVQGLEGGLPQGELHPLVHGFDLPSFIPDESLISQV